MTLYPKQMTRTSFRRILLFNLLLALLGCTTNAQMVETLYNFHTDPANPRSALLPADNDSFYFVADYNLQKVTKKGIVSPLFGVDNSDEGMIKDQHGVVYGTSTTGGSGYGNVYKYSPGEAPVLIADFSQTNGSYPKGKLVLEKDGSLYGVTFRGGSEDRGVIFKITPAGILTPLLSLTSATGGYPVVGLVKGDDDFFYGLTSDYTRAFFKVDANGVFTLLHYFYSFPYYYPMGPLVKAPNGNFYGIGSEHGLLSPTSLSVYEITPSGAFTIIAMLTRTEETYAQQGYLTVSKDGNLYGVTPYGGTNDFGMIFKLSPEGTITPLVHLNSDTGFDSRGELLEDDDGNFYGTMYRGGPTDWGTIFKITSQGDFTVIKAFNSTAGKSPSAILPSPDGNFYGTTAAGGTNSGNGTFFKMTPSGEVTTVYSLDPTNGTSLTLRLIQKDGSAFYLTTQNKILRITSGGQITNFCTLSGANSAFIVRLIAGADENMYGVTQNGGEFGFGFIFQVTLSGAFTRLGSFPASGYGDALLEGKDGNFYGATSTGGIYGVGSIYKMTRSGQVSPVASFKPTGARSPRGTLIQSADGTIYGISSANEDLSYGAIFKLTAPGIPAIVTTFQNLPGLFPAGDLIRAFDGNFYGTMYGGKSIFKVAPDGALSTVFSFETSPPGNYLAAKLAAAADGNLYGVSSGGLYGDGSLYRVVMTPSLKMDRRENSLVFSWPTNFAAFNLQSSINLESTTWTSENKTPSITQDQYTLTNSPLENKKFFRLSK